MKIHAGLASQPGLFGGRSTEVFLSEDEADLRIIADACERLHSQRGMLAARVAPGDPRRVPVAPAPAARSLGHRG